MNPRFVLVSVLVAAAAASAQFLVDHPPGEAPPAAVAPSAAAAPPTAAAAPFPPAAVEPPAKTAAQLPPERAVEPESVASRDLEMELAAVPAAAPPGPAVRRAPPPPSCGAGETASEQILRLSSRVQADVSTGALMPWDAQEISNSLRAASQMLGRREVDTACTTLAQAERRFRAR